MTFDKELGKINVDVGGNNILLPFSIYVPEQAPISVFTEFSLPESCINITGVFAFCCRCERIRLSSKTNLIGNFTFIYTGLKSLYLPKTAKIDINNYVFLFPNIEYINVEEGNTMFDSRNNCNALIYTEENCIIHFSKNTVIPEGIKGITTSDASMTPETIIVPNSVETVGCFFACHNLKVMDIGTGCTKIDSEYAFEQSGLEKLIIRATNPPQAKTSIFAGLGNQFKIYVPDESLEAYKTAPHPWSTNKDVIFPISQL